MAAKALITSMLAAILGAASLGWQIYSWLRYRPRIIVTVAPAVPGDWRWEPRHGAPSHLQVTATNRGHRAAYIKNWGLRLNSKSDFVPQPIKVSYPFPYELQPDAQAYWWAPIEQIRPVIIEHQPDFSKVTAYVQVAGPAGARFYAKPGIPLEPDAPDATLSDSQTV